MVPGEAQIARFKILFTFDGLNTVNCDSPACPRLSSPLGGPLRTRSDSGYAVFQLNIVPTNPNT